MSIKELKDLIENSDIETEAKAELFDILNHYQREHPQD